MHTNTALPQFLPQLQSITHQWYQIKPTNFMNCTADNNNNNNNNNNNKLKQNKHIFTGRGSDGEY